MLQHTLPPQKKTRTELVPLSSLFPNVLVARIPHPPESGKHEIATAKWHISRLQTNMVIGPHPKVLKWHANTPPQWSNGILSWIYPTAGTQWQINSYIVGIPYSRCNNPGGDCCRVRGYWKHDRNEKHAQEKVMQNMEKTIDGTQPAPVDMQYVYIYIIVINYLNGLGKFQNHQQ